MTAILAPAAAAAIFVASLVLADVVELRLGRGDAVQRLCAVCSAAMRGHTLPFQPKLCEICTHRQVQ